MEFPIPIRCYTCNLPLAGKWLTFSGEFLSLAGLRDVQCGIDDLSPPDGRRPRTLPSLLMPPRTVELEAEAKTQAHKQACLAELEAMFREAVARGIYKEEERGELFAAVSESDEALQEILAQNRNDHPEWQTWCKVRIGDADGTPLDAFLRSRGVFTLHPQLGRAPVTSRFTRAVVDKSRFTRAVAESLVRGQKHLKLDCLVDRDLTPEIATVLAAFGKIVSLDGIETMNKELAAPLVQYQGQLLSLQGLGELDGEVEKLFVPVVQDGRAALPGAGMFNIATLRTYAEDKVKANAFTDPQQKKDFASFLDRSKKREWTGKGRAKGQARVVLLLPSEVEFDDGGKRARIVRDAFTDLSKDRLVNLAKDAAVVAAARKDDLLAQ